MATSPLLEGQGRRVCCSDSLVLISRIGTSSLHLTTMEFELQFPYLLIISVFLFGLCTAIDTISPTQSIEDGDTLVSIDGKFELGFFGAGNTSNRYIGIWYNVPNKIVAWVANRDNPVTDNSGVLRIADDGNLVILDGTLKVLWSTNISTATNGTRATLLASGSLVLSSRNHNTTIWESFDHPTNVLLAGMKLGFDWKNGKNWSLTSWKSLNDPANGNFSYRMDPRGVPQAFLLEGQELKWRSGPWNGQSLTGVHGVVFNNNFIEHHYVLNNSDVYEFYHIKNQSLMSMMILDERGTFKRLTWLEQSRTWREFWAAVQGPCDNYAMCGPYGSCSANRSPPCECLQGFEPKSPENWYLTDSSDGCVRRRALECKKRDEFLRLEHVKLPDTRWAWRDASMSLKECENQCLRNCSCTGYSSANVTGQGSGCITWFGDLIDLQLYGDGGQDIYVRVAAAELGANSSKQSEGFFHKKRTLVLPIVIVIPLLLLVSCGYYAWRCKTRRKGSHQMDTVNEIFSNAYEHEHSKVDRELPLFDLGTIVAATENFSHTKILGKGGFGPVYKGQLCNGREIAVKRLSRNSGQGAEEFRNEVELISKLQHRNLVRILGYCIQGEEKMLVYEYMQNQSLDSYIFDQSRKKLLDWRKRFDIIIGIARGVLYLHQDSRLRIIHRDLKASNILLDDEMNPKISDFGIARIFGGNQTQSNTDRVVGTYGYMSPEYAMDGLFSVKSDVFSFGVLILEIVSGKRNSHYSDDSLNLIGLTWKLWTEGRCLETVDQSLSDLCDENEVLRCIHVGLLCVQESPRDRPTMSTVIFMLGNETTMPPPEHPGYSLRNGLRERGSSTRGTSSSYANDMTVTVLEAR